MTMSRIFNMDASSVGPEPGPFGWSVPPVVGRKPPPIDRGRVR